MNNPVDDFSKEMEECIKMFNSVDPSGFPMEDQLMLVLAYKQFINVIKPIYVRNLANGRGV